MIINLSEDELKPRRSNSEDRIRQRGMGALCRANMNVDWTGQRVRGEAERLSRTSTTRTPA